MSVNIVNKSTGALTKIAGNPIEQASGISYDHTSSGMQANNVQAAVDELKSGLTDLSEEVNGDATTYPYADVITIEDAVPANLADCSVKIEPVQDLHGYDKPWVGGAGVNLLPSLVPGTYKKDGIIVTVDNNGNMNISGTKTASGGVTINVPLTSPIDISANYYLHIRNDASDPNVVTMGVTFSGTNRIVDMYDSQGVQNCVVYVVSSATLNINARLSIEKTNDVTDWSPYENICPISGHTEVDVQRDGKNLIGEFENGGFDSNGLNGLSDKRVRSKYYVSVQEGQTYTFNANMNGGSGNAVASISLYTTDDYTTPRVDAVSFANCPVTFTVPNGIKYVRVLLKNSSDGNVTVSSFKDFQLEKGSTATPYAGKTYTIALGSTIYGGTVDFDSGVMTVDRQLLVIDENTQNMSLHNTSDSTAVFKIITGQECVNDARQKSNMFTHDTNGWNSDIAKPCFVMGQEGNLYIQMPLTLASTVSEFITWLASNNVQIFYPLKDVDITTIQLTPQQIQLLKGNNTLTASTGQISVTVNGVSGAIGSLTSDKQDKTDYALETTDKTVVGGINELNSVILGNGELLNQSIKMWSSKAHYSSGTNIKYIDFTMPSTGNRVLEGLMFSRWGIAFFKVVNDGNGDVYTTEIEPFCVASDASISISNAGNAVSINTGNIWSTVTIIVISPGQFDDTVVKDITFTARAS